MITDYNLQILIEPLLHWFAGHARVLPWREEPTPYRVWVSEIMLQQTRVEAVKPYFERFLEALPDVASLASVEDDRLMKLWEGLGYYNRARNLKKAAGVIMEEYGGKLPFNDKADPELIKQEFGLSKNAFKRAVGRLLKEGRIKISEKNIEMKKK